MVGIFSGIGATFPVFSITYLIHPISGTWPINYGIAAEATVGKYGKIAKLPRDVQNSYAFAYVFATFAASPAPFGRPPLWRRPKAASIMGAGEAANIAKT